MDAGDTGNLGKGDRGEETMSIPPLEDDRVAMMLGLVPDKRTPEERLWDAIRTNGESLRFRYCGVVSDDGHVCDRTDEHETHTKRLDCGCTATWTDREILGKETTK